MLPAKLINFRLAFRGFAAGQNHMLSGLEYRIVFEQLLDSDLAFQTLCFCDPSDGYIGGVQLTDETLFQDLEREPLFQLHSRGT